MARKKKAQGLGDSIENVLETTGIASVVKSVFGENCGCEDRKETLNKLWSYRNTEDKTLNCLSEDSLTFLSEFLPNQPDQLTIKLQERLKTIYKEVFNLNFQSTSCGSCWRDMIRELQQVYNATIV